MKITLQTLVSFILTNAFLLGSCLSTENTFFTLYNLITEKTTV